MKAIYLTERDGAQLMSVPMPEIQMPDEVLIRVTSGGICSSDIEIAAGTHPFARKGMVMGHEFGGVVQQVGSAVAGLCPGDKVTVDPVTACGTCHSCALGRPNICLRLSTRGVHQDGGFREYVVMPQAHVYRYGDQSIDPDLLGLAEPFSIGAEMNHRARTRAGDVVLVMGAGPIGLGAMQEARRRGAAVLVTDTLPARLERAAAMGADRVANALDTGTEAALRDFTDGNGFDVIMNAACAPGTMESAIEHAAFGGRIVVVGIDERPFAVSQADFMRKELTMLGSRLSCRLFAHVVEGIDQGTLTPGETVSHFFHFTEFEKAFELIQENPREVCKVVLRFA